MKHFLTLLALSVLSAVASAEDVLHIYNWSDYLPEETIATFEEQCGCRIVYDTFSSNEELMAKLAAGARGYDILVPTDYAVSAMAGRDMLLELDHARLPNMKNLKPEFLDRPFDPGNRFSVPYAVGVTLLGFNADKMRQHGIPTDTWAALFDPKHLAKIKGRVTVLDDQRELMGAALIYLGYSPNDTDPAHWGEARDVILKAKPYWAAFNASNYNVLLAAGDIWLVQGYSMDVYQAAADAEEAGAGVKIGYAIPKEGAYMAVDNLVIPKTAPEPELALRFIDFVLDGRQSAVLSNELGIGNPNMAATEFIDASVLEDPALFPQGDVLSRLSNIDELDARQRRAMNRLWTEIKVQ
jgi:spermidine/putrescine transport system substrate-binding protein